MEGKINSRKRKYLARTENNIGSIKISANSQLLQAVSNGSHIEVASLLASSSEHISKKTFDIAVFQAVANGHKRSLQLLMKHGVNTNSKNSKGFTSLMVASERGYLDIVKLLVKHGADVNSKNKDGKTALFLATEKACSVPLLEFLISSKCCANVNIKNKEGRTALMVAAQLGDIVAMRVLMYHKEIDLGLQDRNGNTAFDIAKQNGLHEEFCTLKECTGNHCINPLIVSVMKRNLRLLKEFIDDDFHNIEQTNADGCTPLILALKNMSHDSTDINISKDIVLTLIKYGADVNRLCNIKFECTPLLCAAESGNLRAVKLLIEHGANMNGQTPVSKLSAVMVAAKNGFCDIVKFLLNSGADINLEDCTNKSALIYALENDKISCVEMFVRHGAEVDDGHVTLAAHMNVALDQYLLYPSVTEKIASSSICHILIERCINKKKYALAEFLLDHCNDVSSHLNILLLTAAAEDAGMVKLLLDRGADINGVSELGQTALMIAAYWNNPDTVRILIERKADINIIDCDGKTASTFAIMEHSVDALEALLQGGCAVNYISSFRDIPLHLSVEHGHIDIAELLIKYGADINSFDSMTQTPLLLAVKQHSIDIVKFLIAKGADLNKQTLGGSTALHIALTDQEIEIAEMLIKGGADVNIADDKGRTALIFCSQTCTTDIMLQLLKSGADVNTVDESESTALHYAIKHSIILTEKAEILLKYGADINKTNNDGHTPFMIANKYCKDNMLRFLLSHGADINTQDKYGSTALTYALSSHNERVAFLITNGADVNIQDNLGRSPLMIAAETCNDVAMKALLDKGADVHAVDRTNSNVLTAILNRYNKCFDCYRENFACKHYVCIELLVTAGARAVIAHYCILALYKAIVCNQLKLVKLLVHSGILPFKIKMPCKMNEWLSYSLPHHYFATMYNLGVQNTDFQKLMMVAHAVLHARSPFITAILCKNAAICEFFIKKWYFNEEDMKRKNSQILYDRFPSAPRNRLTTVCEHFFLQPQSLSVLSFVTVSTCIGGRHDREKQIRTLPVPLIIQERLLYRNSVSDLVTDSDEDTGDMNFVQSAYIPLDRLNYIG